MKTLRIISYIALIIITASLVLGNIFYQQIRRVIDKNYLAIEMNEDNLSKFNNQKNPDYNLYVFTDKNVYSKYEKIKIFARIINKVDNSIPENSVMEVEFFRNGIKLNYLNGNSKIRLAYNESNKVWVGYWYPQISDLSGNIDITAHAYLDDPETSLESKNIFYISEENFKFSLKKGMAFMGIESQERISKRNILSAEGKEVDWNYIPEWLNFISADGILMLGGITKTFQEDINMESPWDNDKVNESVILAERLKQKGKNFGVWIRGLKVEGIYEKKMGYTPSLSIKDDKYFENSSAISILDENRKKNIIKLFTTFMENDNISYIGISDVFTLPDEGIELIDRFIQEFQINVPENWSSLDFDGRFKYFFSKIADKQNYSNFIEWKKYINADYLRDIIDKSGHKKPVFYYVDFHENNRKSRSCLNCSKFRR